MSWYVVLKCAFYFILYFLSASVTFQVLSQTPKWTSLHIFVEKGIGEGEEKLFQLLSKKVTSLALFRMGLFGAAHGWRGKAPLPKICQTYPTIMKLGTLITYLKKIKKMYKSHDTPFDFCWHQYYSPEIRSFCFIKKYR